MINGNRRTIFDHARLPILALLGVQPQPAQAQTDLRALRTHLRRLRQKLGEKASNPTYFLAEPRVGYRMAKRERQEGT